jgi:hypothetical protein
MAITVDDFAAGPSTTCTVGPGGAGAIGLVHHVASGGTRTLVVAGQAGSMATDRSVAE